MTADAATRRETPAAAEARLTWTERGFELRAGRGRVPFAGFDRGVIFDVANRRTGWCTAEVGRAPVWQWNPNPNRFEPQPSERAKRGFSLPCAIGGNRTATWEQAGTAIWGSLAILRGEINGAGAATEYADRLWAVGPADLGRLPLVTLAGVEVAAYKKGGTTIPALRVAAWVYPPACLGGAGTFESVVANAISNDAARREAHDAAEAEARTNGTRSVYYVGKADHY
jgi:hypothetical protein